MVPRFIFRDLVNKPQQRFIGSGGGSVYVPTSYALIAEEQTSGTDAGTSIIARHTRTLNTEIEDSLSDISISSNRISVPEGTYEFEWWSGSVNANHTKTFLYNFTTASDVAISCNSYSAFTSQATKSYGFAIVTVGETTEFEIQEESSKVQGTYGLGRATSLGVETYTKVRIKGL